MDKIKFEEHKNKTLFAYVNEKNQAFIEFLLEKYTFSFQEIKFLCECAIDLRMWDEKSFCDWWGELENEVVCEDKRALGKTVLALFRDRFLELRGCAKVYEVGWAGMKLDPAVKPQDDIGGFLQHDRGGDVVFEKSDKNIFGLCPVASDKTVCCRLRTLDAVQGCPFDCSYCSISTFYSENIVFDDDLEEKLSKIELDPNKLYHVGTGQSSDALVWGNRNGLLDKLCAFAEKNKNVLLEFKTKSDNVDYFLEKNIPKNIVCSWTLNTDTIIRNEEHGTAGLDARINAARKAADKKIKVAFHFHPIVYYNGWEVEYTNIVKRLMREFNPCEIAFISFGSVTFIKPVIKDIRKRGIRTKMLQMDMIADPHGRLTYPDDIKVMQFKVMYEAFKDWHEKVFFYLCMEKREIWECVFGWCYENNEEFEGDLLKWRRKNGCF
ncbi:hypothetical protein KKC59_04165 [bacterium]|nr:hypothetical protein [bacterium]